MKHLFIFLLIPILLTACFENSAAQEETVFSRENNCKPTEEHKEDLVKMTPLEIGKERLDCLYPNPPLGRWHAVYSEEFATKYDLPSENISTDFSAGVDYMEMEVLGYGNGGVGCFVNMLVESPNDFAFYNKTDEFPWFKDFNNNRRLLHLIDIQGYADKVKRISTVGLTTRSGNQEYDPSKSYNIGNAIAFYAEDVLSGYDYISANAECRWILISNETPFDDWAFNIAEASIWGKYESNFDRSDDPGRPQKEDFFNSRIQIDINHELLKHIFKK